MVTKILLHRMHCNRENGVFLTAGLRLNIAVLYVHASGCVFACGHSILHPHYYFWKPAGGNSSLNVQRVPSSPHVMLSLQVYFVLLHFTSSEILRFLGTLCAVNVPSELVASGFYVHPA